MRYRSVDRGKSEPMRGVGCARGEEQGNLLHDTRQAIHSQGAGDEMERLGHVRLFCFFLNTENKANTQASSPGNSAQLF